MCCPVLQGSVCYQSLSTRLFQALTSSVHFGTLTSAPPAQVEDFLRVTMCCPVLQGYGLTESCATSFVGAPNNPVRAGR